MKENELTELISECGAWHHWKLFFWWLFVVLVRTSSIISMKIMFMPLICVDHSNSHFCLQFYCKRWIWICTVYCNARTSCFRVCTTFVDLLCYPANSILSKKVNLCECVHSVLRYHQWSMCIHSACIFNTDCLGFFLSRVKNKKTHQFYDEILSHMKRLYAPHWWFCLRVCKSCTLLLQDLFCPVLLIQSVHILTSYKCVFTLITVSLSTLWIHADA